MKNINYAWAVSSINRDDYIAFEKWLNHYKEHCNGYKIYIWGAGIRGTEFGIFLKRNNIENYEFTDINSEKWYGNIDGVPIVPVEDALSCLKSEKSIILISTEDYCDIKKYLEENDLVINEHFFIAPSLEYEYFVNEFNRTSNNNNLIMGDCLFSSISLSDKSWKNLSDMIKDEIGKEQCKVLYMHGMGIRSYYNIFKLYCENFGPPKKLELMVNFDTLTGKQHLLPRSQHQQLFHMLNDSVKLVNDEFIEYIKIVEERSSNINVEISHKSTNLTVAQEKILKNKNYMKINYLYNLNLEVEGIQFLKKLIAYAQAGDTKIILFIPPVNYELGYDLFGNQFNVKYNLNLDKIVNIANDFKVELIDFSYTFTKDFFAEVDTTDETVNEKGREILKKELCRRLVQ